MKKQRTWSIVLFIVLIMASFSLFISVSAETNAPETFYDNGMRLMMEHSYKDAALQFDKAQGYKDAAQYCAYCQAMIATSELKPLKETYNFFIKAGNIENAAESALFLRETLDTLEGLWTTDPDPATSFIGFNEEGQFMSETKPNEKKYYSLDILCQIYYYGIDETIAFRQLSVGSRGTDSMKSKILYSLEFTDDGKLAATSQTGKTRYYHPLNSEALDAAEKKQPDAGYCRGSIESSCGLQSNLF